MSEWNLVADVGGTHMRLAALSPDGAFLAQKTWPTNGPVGVIEAARLMCDAQAGNPARVAMAGAGKVADGAVTLTNSGVRISRDDLRIACGTSIAHVLNDFEIAAWSLATLSASDVTVLQGDTTFPQAPRMIIGPGTGLGVGALIWSHGVPVVVPGEGGHVRIAPETEAEMRYFAALISDWPEVQMGGAMAVEAEAIVSGTGLPRFYRAIARVEGTTATLADSAAIFAAAQQASDVVAVTAIALFRRYLGALAGDLGMTFGATGGVFITGGVATANRWLFDDTFLAAFNGGGRHSKWRAQMPLHLYDNPDFGLLGARNALMYL